MQTSDAEMPRNQLPLFISSFLMFLQMTLIPCRSCFHCIFVWRGDIAKCLFKLRVTHDERLFEFIVHLDALACVRDEQAHQGKHSLSYATDLDWETNLIEEKCDKLALGQRFRARHVPCLTVSLLPFPKHRHRLARVVNVGVRMRHTRIAHQHSSLTFQSR